MLVLGLAAARQFCHSRGMQSWASLGSTLENGPLSHTPLYFWVPLSPQPGFSSSAASAALEVDSTCFQRRALSHECLPLSHPEPLISPAPGHRACLIHEATSVGTVCWLLSVPAINSLAQWVSLVAPAAPTHPPPPASTSWAVVWRDGQADPEH